MENFLHITIIKYMCLFQGYLCLPYLSLPYLDLLGDVNVRGYIVGATNVLFKQKKQLIDVLVEVSSSLHSDRNYMKMNSGLT